MKRIDITGQKFGMLTAVRFVERITFPSGKSWPKWQFQCDCGKSAIAFLPNVRSGHTRSCGCFGNLRRSESHTTHGGCKGEKPEHLYIVWCSMVQRCTDLNYKRYSDWGGRGIKVLWACYEDFKHDMGPTYQEGLQIERKNNDGHYCLENCTWATAREQALNRRSNIKLELNGEILSVSEWSKRLNLKRQTIERRHHAGWSDQKALTTPVAKGIAGAK